jgi:hypothetical protein
MVGDLPNNPREHRPTNKALNVKYSELPFE